MDITGILAEHSPWWRHPDHRVARALPNRRDVFGLLEEHLTDVRQTRAQILWGLRQTGKTTLLLQLADALLDAGFPPNRLVYFDFSDDRLLGSGTTPRDVVDALPEAASAEGCILLFDEMQRVPGWNDWLKQVKDHGRHKVLVTGSAALRLREGSKESGPGRWDEIRIEGLTYAEYLRLTYSHAAGESPVEIHDREPAAWDRYFEQGGLYPELRDDERLSRVRWRIRDAIVQRAIRKDLEPTGIDVEGAGALFVHLVNSSGSVWNARKRGDDLGVQRATVDKWKLHLEDAGLLVRLNEYSRLHRSASRDLKSRLSPKIYAADHGLVSAFAPLPKPASDPDVRARLLEAVVFSHLRHLVRRMEWEELAYFRPQRSGSEGEIDFVVTTPEGPVAVETSVSRSPAKKVQTLRRGRERLSPVRSIVVQDVESPRWVEDIRILPITDFLLAPELHLSGGKE